jgi:hypothetical protein
VTPSEYDITVIGIGGVAILLIQQTLMAMLRPFIRSSRIFDLLNYVVAGFVLLFLPTLSIVDWQLYGGLVLALGTLASIGAKKVTSATKPGE